MVDAGDNYLASKPKRETKNVKSELRERVDRGRCRRKAYDEYMQRNYRPTATDVYIPTFFQFVPTNESVEATIHCFKKLLVFNYFLVHFEDILQEKLEWPCIKNVNQYFCEADLPRAALKGNKEHRDHFFKTRRLVETRRAELERDLKDGASNNAAEKESKVCAKSAETSPTS